MSKIALIDADSLIYITTYCKAKKDEFLNPILDSEGKPEYEVKSVEDCMIAVDNILSNILNITGSTKYLIFLTVGKNFRYEVYPEYKANRKYSEKPLHFDRVKEYLITKYRAVYFKDLEADDLCLIYKNNIPNSFICSPDKDMLMLEGTHYNYSKNIWVTTNKFEALLNFWTSMITGDTADNIKGIPGKGEKFADSLFISRLEEDWPALVLKAYISKFGEELGISEFYKNYKVLKIRGEYKDLVLVDPIEVERGGDNIEQKEGDIW